MQSARLSFWPSPLSWTAPNDMTKTTPVQLPPLEELEEHFKIVPVTRIGEDSGLIWIKPTARFVEPMSVAGCLFHNSRQAGRYDWRIRYKHKAYLASRVIWKMYYRADPGAATIDHLDGDSRNNNIENLALASHQEQGFNQRVRSDNTSGARGVSWSKAQGKWVAQIGANNTIIRLGVFSCKVAAANAYNEALAARCPSRYDRLKNNLDLVLCECLACKNFSSTFQEH